MIEELAKKWLKYNYFHRDSVEILPFQSSYGLVVYFYDKDTGEDFDWFLTIPMVQELLDGKSPRNVKNKYNKEGYNSGGLLTDDSGGQWINLDKVKRPSHHKNYPKREKIHAWRLWIFNRDGDKCLRCGSKDNLTIDHVIPKSMGGKNHNTNYQTLCFDCNIWKGARHLDYRNGEKPSEVFNAAYELQLIDCNCNDCGHMTRDTPKTQKHNESFKGLGFRDKLQYGYCNKKEIGISFIPMVCQPENQECFVHRKEF